MTCWLQSCKQHYRNTRSFSKTIGHEINFDLVFAKNASIISFYNKLSISNWANSNEQLETGHSLKNTKIRNWVPC